ncbi:MAG TPA: hypothetical protein VEQ40_05700 [Pyrinomonadaceae bacterium]|nr:hypothetical protein [Pyrinomonadaceae bacterium]
MLTNHSAMRQAYTLVLAFCLALGVFGVLFAVVGEWNARRQLPPEMRTPEAIQHYFDGTVCFGCEFGGFMMIAAAILIGCPIALIWLIFELAEWRSVKRLR